MKEEKNNILLIVVDCLRYSALQELLDKGKLPNTEKLLEKSTYFTSAYTTSTTTTPSFTTILSGLYPAKHSVRSLYGYKVSQDLVLVQELLAANNYYTRAEVTGPLMEIVGLNKGFKDYVFREQYETVYTSWWKRFLNTLDSIPKPWFILLHLWELHRPRKLPSNKNTLRNRLYDDLRYKQALVYLDEKLGELYDKVKKDAVIILTGDHGELTPRTFFENLRALSVRGYRKIMRILVSKGFKWFEKYARRPLREVGHGFHIYEYLVHVPLIVYTPHGSKKVFDGLVSHVDIAPTILDLVGIKERPYYPLDGLSLKPVMEEKKRIEHDYVFMEACGVDLKPEECIVGIRTHRYKLAIRPLARDKYLELYDLEEDPNETRNVANQRPEIVKQLLSILEKEYLKYYYSPGLLFKIYRLKKKLRTSQLAPRRV